LQITIFDNRGCTQHKNKEYGGPKAGTADDEMVVKVSNEKIPYPTNDVVEEVQLLLLTFYIRPALAIAVIYAPHAQLL
jgi:hypothetical protein